MRGCRHRDVEWVGPHTHLWWMKIQEEYLRNEESQPHSRLPPAQGSNARKINPHNFWL